jgi:hypothetical protein
MSLFIYKLNLSGEGKLIIFYLTIYLISKRSYSIAKDFFTKDKGKKLIVAPKLNCYLGNFKNYTGTEEVYKF